MLEPIAANLWEVGRPLKLPGLRMGHRMTVIRLASGGLIVHSPVEHEKGLEEALSKLGEVKHFIAPSRFHDLHWPVWFARHSHARFHAAPGVREEHPELPFQSVLTEENARQWEPELSACLIEGMPRINEVVFYHAPTRTLIVADLLFNLSTDQNFLGRLFLKWNKIYGCAGVSRLFQAFIKDRAAFQRSIRRIRNWEIERIVVGHGSIIHTGAAEVLEQAFARFG